MKHIYSLIAGFILFSANLYSCTVFSVSNADTALFGNSEAWLPGSKTRYWVIPASDNSFGRICFGYQGEALAQGGMNEAGLAFDWVASLESSGYELNDTLITLETSLSEKILAEASTVDEAIKYYEKYNEPYFSNAQILLADKNGDAAIVGWQNGKLKVEKKNGKAIVLGYEDTVAFNFLKNIEPINPQNCATILAKVLQRGIIATCYSNIFNLKTGEINVYNFLETSNSIRLNLKEELAKGAHSVNLNEALSSVKIKVAEANDTKNKVYPTICKDSFTLEMRDVNGKILDVFIIDMFGRKQMHFIENVVGSNVFTKTFHISNLKEGNYLVIVYDGMNQSQYKVVKY